MISVREDDKEVQKQTDNHEIVFPELIVLGKKANAPSESFSHEIVNFEGDEKVLVLSVEVFDFGFGVGSVYILHEFISFLV